MLVNFFFGTFFFLIKKKVHCPPAKGVCAQTEVCAELREEQAPPLPWGNGVRAQTGVRAKLGVGVDPLSPTAWELPPMGSLLVAPLPTVWEWDCARRGVCAHRGHPQTKRTRGVLGFSCGCFEFIRQTRAWRNNAPRYRGEASRPFCLFRASLRGAVPPLRSFRWKCRT